MMQLDNELIGVVDNVQIGDVLEDRVGFKDVESASMTFIQLMLHLSFKANKHFKILTCTRISLNYLRFILASRLDV
jgi:hypothetical protein